MTHFEGIRPGEPFPTIAAPLCAVLDCNGPADHRGLAQVRLHGGYQYPAAEVTLEVDLCHEHAAATHDGLTIHRYTAPQLG